MVSVSFFHLKNLWKFQYDLGSDIVMILDECTPYPATFLIMLKNPWKCHYGGQNVA